MIGKFFIKETMKEGSLVISALIYINVYWVITNMCGLSLNNQYS